jgi:hypothetical protein
VHKILKRKLRKRQLDRTNRRYQSDGSKENNLLQCNVEGSGSGSCLIVCNGTGGVEHSGYKVSYLF